MAPHWLRVAETYLGYRTNPNRCAWFVGGCLQASGLPHTSSIKARSYLDYGVPLRRPKKGCLVILWRRDPESTLGHIGFFLNFTEDKRLNLLSSYLGVVLIKPFSKEYLLGYRWPNVISTSKKPRNSSSSN